jgi:hypothetical protein
MYEVRVKFLWFNLNRRRNDWIANREQTEFWNRFWKTVNKKTKKSKLQTSIDPSEFSRYFSGTMQDNSKNLSHEQFAISACVENSYNNMHDATMKLVITPDQVLEWIKRLKRNSSPGIDGICGEFLINGMSDALSSHLSYLCSYILSYNCVPVVFNIGVIVPVLKKNNP